MRAEETGEAICKPKIKRVALVRMPKAKWVGR